MIFSNNVLPSKLAIIFNEINTKENHKYTLKKMLCLWNLINPEAIAISGIPKHIIIIAW